jgi:BirA family transcriptional regulator, biotin operon repressor / biotin---[acetyl-CoA-carboxylase] ligase
MCSMLSGNQLIVFDELESTNDYAIGLLSHQHPQDGTVVFARHQTKGRGQRNRIWLTESGKNLTFSVIWKPHALDVKQSFLLIQSVAVAISDYLEQIGLSHIGIKWPNDVYVNNRKIAGILMESSVKNNFLSWVVTGVGLNVNQTKFPPELGQATSILLEKDEILGVETVLHDLLKAMDKWHIKLKTAQHSEIQQVYKSRLWGLNREVEFYLAENKTPQTGAICGVDELGRIVLALPDGSRAAFHHHQITLSFL